MLCRYRAIKPEYAISPADSQYVEAALMLLQTVRVTPLHSLLCRSCAAQHVNATHENYLQVERELSARKGHWGLLTDVCAPQSICR